MSKYKSGGEVKAGDYVIGPVEGRIIAGKVHELTGKCVILYPVQGRTIFAEIDTAEFFHASDAVQACELVMTGKLIAPPETIKAPAPIVPEAQPIAVAPTA